MGSRAVIAIALIGCGGTAQPLATSPPAPAPVAAVDAGPPKQVIPPGWTEAGPPPDAGVTSYPQVLKKGTCSVADIAAYCLPSGKCPTFQDSWLLDPKAKDSCGGGPARDEMGRCGTGHYIAMNGGYSGNMLWFDAKGTLIAAVEWTDTNTYCDGQSFAVTYGNPPKCTQRPVQKQCADPL